MPYRWAGRDEWMLVQPGVDGRHVLLLQPMFGELNRCRRLMRDVMRSLARRGIGSSLPDLPGTGESPRPLAECSWEDWIDAVAAAQGDARLHLASIRGGALLDSVVKAASRWRLTPVAGSALLRDLERAQAITNVENGPEASHQLAGYRLSSSLREGLAAAEPLPATPLRTARLEGDAGASDATFVGPALWRRAEPGAAPELAEAIAADIADWIERCAAC